MHQVPPMPIHLTMELINSFKLTNAPGSYRSLISRQNFLSPSIGCTKEMANFIATSTSTHINNRWPLVVVLKSFLCNVNKLEANN